MRQQPVKPGYFYIHYIRAITIEIPIQMSEHIKVNLEPEIFHTLLTSMLP